MPIKTLLKESMGLDAGSIGTSAIERAVQERVKARHLDDPDTYWEHVKRSATELQELIETVVVAETWFFRDRGAFSALGNYVEQEWRPTHPDTMLRILSLPCASGEEPYSIVMTLLD